MTRKLLRRIGNREVAKRIFMWLTRERCQHSRRINLAQLIAIHRPDLRKVVERAVCSKCAGGLAEISCTTGFPLGPTARRANHARLQLRNRSICLDGCWQRVEVLSAEELVASLAEVKARPRRGAPESKAPSMPAAPRRTL